MQHAANGAIAVERFKERPYDVVLMDCRMPVMDGYQATRAIRAQERVGARTPIVALSANSLPTDRAACLEAGADQFLTKPIGLAQLTEALQPIATRRVQVAGA